MLHVAAGMLLLLLPLVLLLLLRCCRRGVDRPQAAVAPSVSASCQRATHFLVSLYESICLPEATDAATLSERTEHSCIMVEERQYPLFILSSS